MARPQLRNYVSGAMVVLIFVIAEIRPSAASKFGFEVLNTAMTYEKATRACKDLHYSGLAILDTPEKEAYARTLVYGPSKDYFGDLWIGMQYSDLIEDFVWNTGALLGNVTWYYKEPNDKGRSNCGRIKSDTRGIGFASSRCDWKPRALCGNYESSTTSLSLSQNTGPKDSLPSIIWKGTVRSLLECHILSSDNANSKYTSFDLETNTCILLDGTFDMKNDVVERNGVVVAVSSDKLRDGLSFG